MKILKIYIKNINSLKGEHTIDFTVSPLLQSGLYAIVGQTGAGKSTILDCITLALFNQVPRFETKLSKDFLAQNNAIITRGTSEAVTEVTFLAADSKVYCSRWEARINNRGNVSEPTMSVMDLELNKKIEEKKYNVPKLNAQLTGLDYEQFLKAILLSQGEFARFLKANQSERAELLEKITGTSIYRQLGKKVFEVYRDRNNALKNQRELLAMIEKDLLSDIQIASLQTAEQAKITEKKALNEQIQALQQQIEVQNKIAVFEKEIQVLNENLQSINLQEQKFQVEKGQKLSAYETIIPFITDLREWESIAKSLLIIEKNISENEKKVQKNEEKKAQTFKNIQALIQKNDLATDEIETELGIFKQKIIALQTQNEQLTSEGKKKGNTILQTLQQQAIGIKETKEINEQTQEKVKEIIAQKQAQRTAIIAQIGERSSEENEVLEQKNQAAITEIQEAKSLLNQYLVFQQQTQQHNQTIAQQTQTKQDSEVLIKKSEQKEQQQIGAVEALRTTLQQLVKENLLEVHRAELQTDCPCPLCGATEHHLERLQTLQQKGITTAIEQQIKEQEKALKTTQKEGQSAKNQLVDANTKIDNARSALQQINPKSSLLGKDLEQIAHNLLFSDDEETHFLPTFWEQRLNEKQEENKRIREYENLHRSLQSLQNIEQEIQDLMQLRNEIRAVITELKGLYKGSDIEQEVGNLIRDLTISQTLEKTLEQEKINLLDTKNNIENIQKSLHAQLLPRLQTLGVASIEQASTYLLTEKEVQTLRQEWQQIISNKREAENKKNIREKDIAELIIHVQPNTNIQSLQAQKKDFSSTFETLEREIQHIFAQINHQKEQSQKANTIRITIATQQQQNRGWELLNSLIGDATGKNFSNFAQSLTMKQLVTLANRRLQDLNDRYLLEHREDSDKGEDLMVVDAYLANEKRVVTSLSGGETFLVSLALALGLSDLASRKVQLESLFIDEGFGTLSPDVLDMALSTIEKLQSEEGKQIGIISHVDALKERISTQIRVEKGLNGMSSISINA